MANKVYQHDETALWFVPATAAQAEDAAFEVHNLAAGAGRQSAQHNFGTSARASLFVWRAFVQFIATPVLEQTIDIYVKTSDGTHPDNDDGTTEGPVSSVNKLKNCLKIGSIVVDEALLNVPMASSGIVYLPAQYLNVIFWNASADGLTNDVDENGFSLTPVPPELQ